MAKKKRAEVIIEITRGKSGRAYHGREPQVYSYTTNTPGASTPDTNRKRYSRSNGALRVALRKLKAFRLQDAIDGTPRYACLIKGRQVAISIVRTDKTKRK